MGLGFFGLIWATQGHTAVTFQGSQAEARGSNGGFNGGGKDRWMEVMPRRLTDWQSDGLSIWRRKKAEDPIPQEQCVAGKAFRCLASLLEYKRPKEHFKKIISLFLKDIRNSF